MTVKDLLEVFDSNRDMGCRIEVLDGNGETQAIYRTDSKLIEKIEDMKIDSIDGDTIRLWLEGVTL